jgi:hypothetical protein
MSVDAHWWEHFFEGLPVKRWLEALSHEHTESEADAIARWLSAPPGADLLDPQRSSRCSVHPRDADGPRESAWPPSGTAVVEGGRDVLNIEYTFLSNGRSEVRYGSHQAYRYAELRRLLESWGFDVADATPWTRDAHSVTFIANDDNRSQSPSPIALSLYS